MLCITSFRSGSFLSLDSYVDISTQGDQSSRMARDGQDVSLFLCWSEPGGLRAASIRVLDHHDIRGCNPMGGRLACSASSPGKVLCGIF